MIQIISQIKTKGTIYLISEGVIIMAHDPSKHNCSDCEKCKSRFQDGVEISRYCKIDEKSIEFWGEDVCPIKVITK